MSTVARRITTTTKTTSSESSSKMLGGGGSDGVPGWEGEIGDVRSGELMEHLADGNEGGFRRMQELTYLPSKEDADNEELMEPDMSDTNHMKFVDGRCSCCPYGYHVDLDFLQHLDSMNNGSYLNSLKKSPQNKEQYRKSMEYYLQQQDLSRRGLTTLEKENRGGPRKSSDDDLDNNSRSIERRQVFADGTNRSSDVHYDKTYTEMIELRKIHHHAPLRNPEFDSSSSLSMSSGPSSPTFHYSSSSGLEPLGPAGLTTKTTTTTTQGIVPAKAQRLVELEEQLLEIQPVPQVDHLQRTYVNSAEFAALLKKDEEETSQRRSATSGDERNGATDTTRISAASLQAIREQMAASLRRMHELEEQVKEIPMLQDRNSALKDEKRRLELQLQQSKGDKKMTCRSIGVGDAALDGSDIDDRVENWKRLYGTESADGSSRQTRDGRDGDDGLYRSSTTMSLGYGVDGELIPVRVHEKELKTEENTEIREKEVKTIFLGGGGNDLLNPDVVNDRIPSSTGRPVGGGRPAKRDVRSIGIGDGNVFDASSSMEVHEKELRTVYIGDSGKVMKSTRNVGILCKPAMRDVGMLHMTETEKPMTRTIAAGVGEIGVGDGGYYVEDGEGMVVREGDGEGGGGVGDGGVNSSSTMSQMMSITAYQTRNAHLKNDQLRTILDEMLKRTVHSVAIQCCFSTEDKGVDAARVGYEMVDVGCSDDTTEVDVVPIRIMKSVAIDFRPSLFHRACGTDAVYKIDMATNTQTQGLKQQRATNTETRVTYPATTNTDPTICMSSATETEKSVFFALEQIQNTGTNTEFHGISHVGLNTELTGDIEKSIVKPVQKDNTTNTICSSLRVLDVATNTQQVQSTDKAVSTSAVAQLERGVNTEKTKVAVASVNTERSAFVTRGTNCNIVQEVEPLTSSSSWTEDGIARNVNRGGGGSSNVVSSRSTVVVRSEPVVETHETQSFVRRQHGIVSSEAAYPIDSGIHRETVETIRRSGGTQTSSTLDDVDRSTVDRKSSAVDGGSSVVTKSSVVRDQGSRENFPSDDDTFRSSGGSSSITRTVRTVERGGGRLDGSEMFRDGDVGRQELFGESGGDATEGRHMTRTVETRTVARGGGRLGGSDIFREGDIGRQELFGESGADAEGRHTTRTVETRYIGGGSGSGGGGSHGTSLVEGKIGRQELFGESGADATEGRHTTRTVETRYIGGGSGGGGSHGTSLIEDFRNLDDMKDVKGGRDAEGRQTTRTLETRYIGGGSGSGGGGSHGTSLIEGFRNLDDMKELKGGRDGGYTSTTRTVITKCGDVSESPESWHHETWVSGKGWKGEGNEHESGGRVVKTSSSSQSSSRGGITFSEMDKNKYETSAELLSACNVYGQWLQDSTNVTSEQRSGSLAVIQKEWFNVSSHKMSSSAQVEYFITMINEISRDLIKQVVNMADANGNTALHYAVSNCNMDIVSLILDTGLSNINHQNKTSCTAVMMAALMDIKTDKHRDVIRRLFEMGDVNVKAMDLSGNVELAGQTALMLAVSHGRLDMVKMLLDSGADINTQDEDGSTALMVASEHGHTDIVRLLLTRPNCDVMLTDNDGSTAISIAKEAGNQTILQLLNAQMNSTSSSQTISLRKARKKVTQITLGSPEESS